MQKKLMLVFGALVFMVVSIVAVQLVIANAEKNSIREVSDQMVTDVLNGDNESSYDLFSETAQQDTTPEQWKETVASTRVFFAARSATFVSLEDVEGIPDLKTATYTIDGNDGSYDIKVVLSKIDGEWRVDSFASVLKS